MKYGKSVVAVDPQVANTALGCAFVCSMEQIGVLLHIPRGTAVHHRFHTQILLAMGSYVINKERW